MARSAEVGAITETDTALFELGMRVLETERGDVEPHEEAGLRTLAQHDAGHGLEFLFDEVEVTAEVFHALEAPRLAVLKRGLGGGEGEVGATQGGREGGLQAVSAAVPPQAWWLLLGNLCWVLAYDTEYAMVDRDDDLGIGIQTSAITLGRWDVAAVMLCYAAYLASWAALGWSLGLGRIFLLGIATAAAQAVWHFSLIRQRSREGCFKAFKLNHWLGFAVFAGVALDLALRRPLG